MNQPTQYGNKNVLYSSENKMLTTYKLLIVSGHPRSRWRECHVMTHSLPLTGCRYIQDEKYIKNTVFKPVQHERRTKAHQGGKTICSTFLFSSCVIMSAAFVLVPVIWLWQWALAGPVSYSCTHSTDPNTWPTFSSSLLSHKIINSVITYFTFFIQGLTGGREQRMDFSSGRNPVLR